MKKRKIVIFVSLIIVLLSVGLFTLGAKQYSVLSLYNNGENQVVLVNYLVSNYRTKQVYEKSILNFEDIDYNASANELLIMTYAENKNLISIYNVGEDVLKEKRKIEIEGEKIHSMFGLDDTDHVSYIQNNKLKMHNYHDNVDTIIYEDVKDEDICFLRDEESIILLENLNDQLYNMYLVDLYTKKKTKLLSKESLLGISNNMQYVSVTDGNSINKYKVYDVEKLEFLEHGMMDSSIVQCVPANDLSEYIILTSDLSNSEMKIIDDNKMILVDEGRFHFAKKVFIIR